MYDYTGAFITTLDPINLTQDITEEINKGYGTAGFSFPAVLGNYGEGSAIWYNNKVKIVVVDMDSGPDGTVIFTGRINDYDELSGDGEDRVSVELEAYTSQIFNTPLKDGDNLLFKTRASSTALAETLADAEARETADVKKRIIDLYRAEQTANGATPEINYATGSIDNSGQTITYSWNGEICGNALEETREWEPAHWFTRITAEGVFHSHAKPSAATHRLILGKHFKTYRANKGLTDVMNYIPFSNGDSEPRIMKVYKDAASIQKYGMILPQEKIIVDSRVTVLAKADQKMNALLAERKDPIIKLNLTLLDNNYQDDGFGIDLETVFVGDTVTIEGLDELNSQAVAENLTIISVRKAPDLDSAEIELEGVRFNSSAAVAQTSEKVAVIQASGRIERVLSTANQAYPLELQNSWVNYGSDWAEAEFWKDKEGRVYIWGMVKNGATASGTLLTTLPPAFRPAKSEIFLVHGHTGVNPTSVRIDVHPDGRILLAQSVPTASVNYSAWLTLSGIGFYTSENKKHEHFGFANNWRAYVDEYPADTWKRPGYFKSPTTGVVYCSGLALNGTPNVAISLVPDDARSQYRSLLHGIGNNNFRRINVIGAVEGDAARGQIYTGGASGGEWLSISGMHWLSKTGSKYERPAFKNSFSTYGATLADPSPWGRPGYYIDEFGFGHLEGLVTGGSANAVIFTLPTEFAPKKKHKLTVCSFDGVLGAVEIMQNGDVQTVSGLFSTNFFSLGYCIFPTF